MSPRAVAAASISHFPWHKQAADLFVDETSIGSAILPAMISPSRRLAQAALGCYCGREANLSWRLKG